MTRRCLELYVIGFVSSYEGNAVTAREYAVSMQTVDKDGVEFWTEVANYIGAAYPITREKSKCVRRAA